MYLQKVPSSREDLMGLNTEKYAFDKAVNSSFVYESPLGMDYLLYCMLIALFIQEKTVEHILRRSIFCFNCFKKKEKCNRNREKHLKEGRSIDRCQVLLFFFKTAFPCPVMTL